MDSTRVREIVMPDTKCKRMIGFAGKKINDHWIFENEYDKDILSIVSAIDKEDKAGYLDVGFDMTPEVPPIPLFIIAHMNKYNVQELSESVEMGLRRCTIGRILVVKIAGDGD